jgi:hypothetical protein
VPFLWRRFISPKQMVITCYYFPLLRSIGMQIFKFVKCSPFKSIIHILCSNPWYEKLVICCSSKCNETL